MSCEGGRGGARCCHPSPLPPTSPHCRGSSLRDTPTHWTLLMASAKTQSSPACNTKPCFGFSLSSPTPPSLFSSSLSPPSSPPSPLLPTFCSRNSKMFIQFKKHYSRKSTYQSTTKRRPGGKRRTEGAKETRITKRQGQATPHQERQRDGRQAPPSP